MRYYAEGVTTHDNQRQIDQCLECEKAECTNCLHHKKNSEWRRARRERDARREKVDG